MVRQSRTPRNFRRSTKPTLLKAIFAAAVAVVAVCLLVRFTVAELPVDAAARRTAAFDQSIKPILADNSRANAAALQSLEAGIRGLFDQYRSRVPAFTKDITGLGNKSQMAWDGFCQLASDDQERVQRHVTGKFEMHVVSATAMQQDLEALVHAFQRDLEANRNVMLGKIEAAVQSDAGLRLRTQDLTESVALEFRHRLAAESKRTGRDTVAVGGLTLVTSIAVEEAVRCLVTAALVRVGAGLATSVGATAATAGGVTAAGGAGGGAAGTVGGPVGVAAGVVVGIVAGFAVDWIMSERMETRLTDECRAFLTKVEGGLTDSPGGLLAAARTAVGEMDRIQSSVIEHQLQILP